AQSRIDAGVSAGVVKLTGQRSEQVVSGVLEYEPSSWLTLYAIPAILHVSDSSSRATVSSSGLGDLPVVAAVSRTFATPWSPTLGAALVAVLPTGNASCGLANGQTAGGMDLGVGMSPGHAHLSVDASRSISGVSAQSSLSAPVGRLGRRRDGVCRHLTGDRDDPATAHQDHVQHRHHGQDRLPLGRCLDLREPPRAGGHEQDADPQQYGDVQRDAEMRPPGQQPAMGVTTKIGVPCRTAPVAPPSVGPIMMARRGTGAARVSFRNPNWRSRSIAIPENMAVNSTVMPITPGAMNWR